MRRLSVQCASYILGPFGKDCALRACGLKYTSEKGERSKKKARVAVARKLAVQLPSIWKDEQAWKAFPNEPMCPPRRGEDGSKRGKSEGHGNGELSREGRDHPSGLQKNPPRDRRGRTWMPPTRREGSSRAG